MKYKLKKKKPRIKIFKKKFLHTHPTKCVTLFNIDTNKPLLFNTKFLHKSEFYCCVIALYVRLAGKDKNLKTFS